LAPIKFLVGYWPGPGTMNLDGLELGLYILLPPNPYLGGDKPVYSVDGLYSIGPGT
jgi:hypothetical protein